LRQPLQSCPGFICERRFGQTVCEPSQEFTSFLVADLSPAIQLLQERHLEAKTSPFLNLSCALVLCGQLRQDRLCSSPDLHRKSACEGTTEVWLPPASPTSSMLRGFSLTGEGVVIEVRNQPLDIIREIGLQLALQERQRRSREVCHCPNAR